EFGDVSSTSLLPVNPSQYGGAIHADFSNLTISNCEISNNKAGWGGGIFINSGKNPLITNCTITNNTAVTSGGGIYTWFDTYSLILNSIITFNSAGTGGGGGIFIGREAKNVRIINSIISNNYASDGYGHNIRFQKNINTEKPKFINSIIWQPVNSIVYIEGRANAADFENCAILTPNITYTNSITLGLLNSAINGPNFTATDGSDWSLTANSPCINKGLDNSSDPDVPLTDFLGNPRYGTTDIGAYEFIFTLFTWQGDDASDPTLWNDPDNWDSGIVPSGIEDIIIPSGLTNYPVGSALQDYSIGSGKQMTIESGARLTLNNLTNNGTLKLNHNASGFASLILNSYTRGASGTEEIQLFLSGGGSSFLEDYKWHYISSPVSSLSADVFTNATLDLAQFIESRPSTSLQQGWVAYDGYIYSTGGSGGPTFSSLTPGQGYNFWDDSDNTFTFGGSFNTSDLTMPLGYSGVPATMHGFNLLGNPFSSGLDWDDIIEGVYFAYPANTSKSLYFTRNNTQCTYAAGVGLPEDVNGIIPPMQGFFTKTSVTGNSITLPSAARTHDNIHPRYKGDEPIPLVRLAIFENTVSNDETVVRFDEEAKSDLDNDFDAVKMFLSDTKTSIYTSLDGVDYAINGIPFPETSVEIPVVVNVTTTGMHKISTTQLQGLDNYYIYLKDILTATELNLKDTPDLSFSAPAGKISGRFILKISTTPTGTEDPQVKPGQFIIYHGYDLINIQPLVDDWAGIPASVRLMDMSGKGITDMQNVEFQRNSMLQMQAPKAKGLYFVEIRSGVRRYVGKVVVK
ncbi:MAG TPA: right-handed parallel beta-helix repeat-containing protein, partial [Bacteroidales bacterium]|nr:right-handed parallel beta-helix repeat-containing protein [Bacteroidales bacterium]